MIHIYSPPSQFRTHTQQPPPSTPHHQRYDSTRPYQPKYNQELVHVPQKTGQSTHAPRGITAAPGAPLMYITFTPRQATSLVASLTDPEKQPMPFYRRIAQIQKTYTVMWQDLVSLCEIKAGDAYWPVMLKSFNDNQNYTDNTYDSGWELSS